MKSTITIPDIAKIVDIGEEVILLLASLPSQEIGTLNKKQLRAIILGDFLITSAGLTAIITVNIIKHIIENLDLEQCDFLDPSLQILDYQSVILITNSTAAPLFICDNKGRKMLEMSDNPPTMLLTIFLTHLFRRANV